MRYTAGSLLGKPRWLGLEWVMQVGNLARILAWPKLLKETRTGHLGLRMADMRLPNNVTARPLVRGFKKRMD